jgi:hypothetical protein
MTEKILRRFQLNPEKLETLDDVKMILHAMQIRIDTDNNLYEELKDYFTIEVVPQGYLELLDVVGDEQIATMTYEEIEQKAHDLLINEKTD